MISERQVRVSCLPKSQFASGLWKARQTAMAVDHGGDGVEVEEMATSVPKWKTITQMKAQSKAKATSKWILPKPKSKAISQAFPPRPPPKAGSKCILSRPTQQMRSSTLIGRLLSAADATPLLSDHADAGDDAAVAAGDRWPNKNGQLADQKDPVALNHVALLFRCFLEALPLERIQSPVRRCANPDELMKDHGMKFIGFVESRMRKNEAAPPHCSLVQYWEALWHYFHPKLSNDQERVKLSPPPGGCYRLNDLSWRGFWIGEGEFERSCGMAVTEFSVARPVDSSLEVLEL